MGSTFIEVQEMPAPNAYDTKSENAKHSEAFSRSLQNTPGGFTTDHRGNVTENRTTTVTQGHQSGQPGDVLKSARSQHGAPVEVITDDTVVEINGVTATARSMAKAGLLTKNHDDSYSEKAPQKAVAPKKTQRVDPLSRDSRARVETLEALVGKQNTSRIMDKMAAAAGRGVGLNGIAKELADLGGIQPEATKAFMEGFASDLDAKLSRSLVQGVGITQTQGEAALDWMYKNLSRSHVSSMFAGALHGDTQALSAGWEKYRLASRKINNQ